MIASSAEEAGPMMWELDNSDGKMLGIPKHGQREGSSRARVPHHVISLCSGPCFSPLGEPIYQLPKRKKTKLFPKLQSREALLTSGQNTRTQGAYLCGQCRCG